MTGRPAGNALIVDVWIERWGRSVAFGDMPHPARCALAEYMGLSGEAWEEVPVSATARGRGYVARWLQEALPRYTQLYGHERFGLVDVPMRDLCDAIMTCNQDVRDVSDGDWDAYHAWYARGRDPQRGAGPGFTDVWPVILDRDHDEIVQDGWHRLHDYYDAGVPVVPCVYYLR